MDAVYNLTSDEILNLRIESVRGSALDPEAQQKQIDKFTILHRAGELVTVFRELMRDVEMARDDAKYEVLNEVITKLRTNPAFDQTKVAELTHDLADADLDDLTDLVNPPTVESEDNQ